jgi:hypothetical protein
MQLFGVAGWICPDGPHHQTIAPEAPQYSQLKYFPLVGFELHDVLSGHVAGVWGPHTAGGSIIVFGP